MNNAFSVSFFASLLLLTSPFVFVFVRMSVFGFSCVEKWLANPKTQRCPNCNAKAQKRDIRLVIPLVLVADDTTEMERTRANLAEEQHRTNEARQESARWKSQYTKAKQDTDKLRIQLESLQGEKNE